MIIGRIGILSICMLLLSACSLDVNLLGKTGAGVLPSDGTGLFPLGEQKAYFGGSVATATDSAGNIYVADPAVGGSITMMNTQMATVRVVAATGSGDGQVSSPNGMVVDSHDNLYINDYGNGRIQKLDSSGNFVRKWGVMGGDVNNPFEFNVMTGIAIDSQDNIYVLNMNGPNHGMEVRVFDTDGNLVRKWGQWDDTVTCPGCDGYFVSIYGIAIDKDDYVYVGDYMAGRIQKFSSTGVHQLDIGTPGAGAGQIGTTSFLSIAVANSGVIYVAQESSPPKVQKFSAAGTYISELSSAGSSQNQFVRPWSIGFDRAGNILVSDLTIGFSGGIKKFSASESFISFTQSGGNGDGQLSKPFAVSISKSNFVVAADAGNFRVVKWDLDGNWLLNFGSQGWGNGQFVMPVSIAADDAGFIYVLDYDQANSRIMVQKFSSSGTFIRKWDGSAGAGGAITGSYGLTVSGAGDVYVADALGAKIQKFDTDGNHIADLGVGTFVMPVNIAIGLNNNLFVTDGGAGKVFEINATTGAKLNEFGGGLFSFPWGIAVNPLTGDVYAGDLMSNTIKQFSASGVLGTIGWGGFGFAAGKFSGLAGMASDENGFIYAADNSNSRIQKFNALGVAF